MKWPAYVLVVLLAACASVTKVEGTHQVNEKLSFESNAAWNLIELPGSSRPYKLLTQEGITIDEMRLWASLASGKDILNDANPSSSGSDNKKRRPVFEAGMSLDQLTALFESAMTLDGSVVQMTKIEPDEISGVKGVRFQFTWTRKSDGVILLGLGWAGVLKNELYAATFTAPRLHFYDKLSPKAEALFKSLKIKG
jgi:hypothetical protein